MIKKTIKKAPKKKNRLLNPKIFKKRAGAHALALFTFVVAAEFRVIYAAQHSFLCAAYQDYYAGARVILSQKSWLTL